MRLNKITLKHYRNYEETALTFPKPLTIFLGENAQGKTNMLESIYVLAMTRSHRTSNEKELITFGQTSAKIEGTVEKKTGSVPLEIFISNKGRKTKVNHIEQKRLSSYIGQLNVILFAPEDLSLVKGSPQVRRKFIDMELGQVNPIYLYDLVQYQSVLKQRNQYLKQLADKRQADTVYLDILTEQLAEFGGKVLFARFEFIKKLEKWANELHKRISHGREELAIDYASSVALTKEQHSVEELQQLMLQQLMSSRKRELFKATTFIGPHRDDLIFNVNQQNVQTYGSQGQQRTTALSVKLAEVDLMYAETGEYPVLLLDDVMSELDDERQLHLLETIEGKVQTFITTTTLSHLTNKITVEPDIFHVRQGEIVRESND